METDNKIPELRKNQFGISVKTYDNTNKGFALTDEILYFTVNSNDISMELYPKKPVIVIDKDALKMILNKISKIDKESSSKRDIPNVPIKDRNLIKT